MQAISRAVTSRFSAHVCSRLPVRRRRRSDGHWRSPWGMLGGRKAGGRQRHGVRSATQRAGLLATRQGQTVTSKSQDGKRGLLTAPSQAKSPPRDAVYLQELAEAQPSLRPLQPNVTVLLYTTKGQELGKAVGLPGDQSRRAQL